MQVETILNFVTDYKSFVFSNVYFDSPENESPRLVAELVPRKNSQGICPECKRRCPTYDTSPTPRFFEFVPLWNIAFFFAYRMRRVTCPEHGVVTEEVPWCEGKHTQTVEMRQFLANWARRLSWKETAECFGTSPGKVFRAVKWIVEWGLENRDLSGITKIGVDEIQRSKGHNYMTLLYQLDDENKRLLEIEPKREEQSLEQIFDRLDEGSTGEEKRSLAIEFVCSDMWKPFLNVIEHRCPNALNILDRFHVKSHLTKAVDEVRKADVTKLQQGGREAVLTKSKYIFLKNPENLTEKQAVKLSELLGYNLQVIRAYLMKEDFERFWEYKSPYWAGRFLDEWCVRTMRSKIEPMKKFVGTLRKHRTLLLNWFKSNGLSSGIVEGFNNKVKLTVRKGYGYGADESLKITLFHALGKLTEPKCTHRFW